MLLVAGFSGIGKTALVNEVHKPIVEKRGYFIKGKFDQFNRNIPFSALVQAFRGLMGQLLSESDKDLAKWRSKILDAVGENGQVLVEVIPELEQVIGPQAGATELSGTASQNRFNLLFQKFIAVFTTPEHPLVMFLDDLQWADSASLNLMKVLLRECENEHLLLLGAYRDNEVFPAHPLMLTLDELVKESAEISTIMLAPLPITEINRLVAETLSCSSELAKPLTELVYQKTNGNPFFTTQFLKGIHEDDLIVFDRDLGYWRGDLARVRDAVLTDDVVEFMAERLLKLPQETQDVLKLAACIGNQFDLDTLAVVCKKSTETVAADLWEALREGLILSITDTYKFFQSGIPDEEYLGDILVGYRFLHERVQQAAYSLIPKVECDQTHLLLGQLLLENVTGLPLKSYSPQLQPDIENIFNIINQLNAGASLLSDRQEKETLSFLNLQAGRKAKVSTAYTTALNYIEQGLALLDEDPWEDQYKLCLSLTDLAAELAYLCGDFQRMHHWVMVIREHAQTLLDRIKADGIEIQGLMARCQFSEEMELTCHVLQLLGIELPQQISSEDIDSALARVRSQLGSRSIASLATLNEMEEPEKCAAMGILLAAIPAAYIINPPLFLLMVLQQMSLSLGYGHSAISPFAFAAYGIVRCGIEADVIGGYEFGMLAIEILSARQRSRHDPDIRAIVTYAFHTFLSHWCVPLRESLSGLKQVYMTALESGDLQHAALSSYRHSQHLMYVGCPLVELKTEADLNGLAIEQTALPNSLSWNNSVRQFARNLMGETPDPCLLTGEVYDEDQAIEKYYAEADRSGLHFVYNAKLVLHYFFTRYEEARKYSDLAFEYLDAVMASPTIPVFYFYDSLVHLELSRTSKTNKVKWLERVDSNQAKMQIWAKSAPTNYSHKYHLVAAERYRLEGQYLEAIEAYEHVIAGAKDNEYIQEEALANELFARFYLDWSKEKYAALHMQEAYYCYARWGAKAKTDHLAAHYPDLLAPILQKQRTELNATDNLTLLTQTLTDGLASNSSSSTGISATLDLASVLQSAQKLTAIIELEQLLNDITEIILTNAGAQKMALLAPDGEQWQIQVIATRAEQGKITTQTQARLLSEESPLPIRLIQYVKNTQESVLIDEAKIDIPGILPGYLLKNQPQSVLCLPLLNQGQLVAIAYLEHPTTQGVFTPSCQTVVEFLCAQGAIALQNSQLYDQAQTALTDLQQAQLQLVQGEKMSALGNLVAGVAHEINNPVGFLQGNIKPAKDYVQDLLGLIDLYQEKYPEPDAEIEDEIEAIDLDFVREDLPNLIESMNTGADRIRSISTSLRTFSRMDVEHKTAFDIHDGIDSTLLILKHRTKANEARPAVEITKYYGELPELQCFPGQLNQVFMNILANAIDAFDDANRGKSCEEIEREPNRIQIHTVIMSEGVQVQIRDNGCGIEPDAVERIFEQGFTTKRVGKGTGLGMAIAHQIVTEKHGGSITCASKLGEGSTVRIILPL